ncbi:hypothetical protein EHQ59_08435 [Leptospira kemamanensis]|uniref:Uncharacterized protein n=1 Tax=Leptospira kemamanensis TaxID=2484942 RepID=A0A4R9JQ00_9LEPT|nr:hypothetical protein [Leptospira kemamanensis]TGL53606.1 hypothetical protein EHQ59_08435 [Leptospira kemamanensis]
MKRILVFLVLILVSTQCKLFKASSLDPSEDLGTLQSLLRLLALADAFNTQSQSVLFMKFTDASGTPYAGGAVEYSVFNEADENGVAVSDFGETGNVRTYTATLDAFGRGFLFFSERGIAKLSLKNAGNTFVATADFRIYNGITKQSFSILNQTGSAQFLLEDLANYRNRLATNFTFTPLGSANGRQFIYLEVQTDYVASDKFKSLGYIASSADGENYDQVTKIEGVTFERNVTEDYILKISNPLFNGSDYVFFLSEAKRAFPTTSTLLDNRNLYLQFSALSPPSSATVKVKTLPANHLFFNGPNGNWYYPALYLGEGRYMAMPILASAPRPILFYLESDSASDLVSGFSCTIPTPDRDLLGFQLVTHLGINYLQCPQTYAGAQYLFRSIRVSDLISNQITFSAVSNFDSPVFQVEDKLVSLNGASPYNGITYPSGSYANSNPTISQNATITNFSSSLSGLSSRLRSIKSSNANHYFILSNSPTFTALPTNIDIFRSNDGLTSATSISNSPFSVSEYSVAITSPEQLQSSKGLLNYSYAKSFTTGVSTLPVYFTRFTKEDGTWEDLPRLIKIK